MDVPGLDHAGEHQRVADLRPALGGNLLRAAHDLAEEAALVAVGDQLLQSRRLRSSVDSPSGRLSSPVRSSQVAERQYASAPSLRRSALLAQQAAARPRPPASPAEAEARCPLHERALSQESIFAGFRLSTS